MAFNKDEFKCISGRMLDTDNEDFRDYWESEGKKEIDVAGVMLVSVVRGFSRLAWDAGVRHGKKLAEKACNAKPAQ